jgi:glutaredoxin-dependent peroxiredoxin
MSLLRDRRDDFAEAGVEIFGVSRDSPYTHVAWSQVLDLNFPLLSDWNGEAVRGFGVEQPDYREMKGVAERSAFLVDDAGTVRGAWRYATDELPDVDELLAAARSL